MSPAPRRFLAALMMGASPDEAMRSAGITAAEAGAALKPAAASLHIVAMAQAAGVNADSLRVDLAAVRLRHRNRIAELVALADLRAAAADNGRTAL